MTVLSESTLKSYISSGQIIVGGNETDIRGQSYSCHAAKIFPGGPGDPEKSQATILDWANPTDADVYRIQPRQLVWVRIRETVCLPPDVCAFWWQTNSLSRKGLMLVNMSMVDSGYEGSLACLFVNFGRQPVDIDPGMTVARLVFHRLDAADKPYGKGDPRDEYDRNLRGVALDGPTSFLGFQEFSAAFQAERDKVFGTFKLDAEAHVRELQAMLDKKLDDAFKDKAENLPKFLLKSYGYAAAGFGLLALAVTVALTVAPWIKDRFGLDIQQQIQTAVDSEIGKRLQPVSTIEPSRTQELDRHLQELDREIRALKQPPQGGSSP
jgi:deoxycytidine triphosphate deaminase